MVALPNGPARFRDQRDVEVSTTQPTTPADGDLWMDVSSDPHELWRWDDSASEWVRVGVEKLTNLLDVDGSDTTEGYVLTRQADGSSAFEGLPDSDRALVPLSNGDPDNPAYLFGPDGVGLLVEVTL